MFSMVFVMSVKHLSEHGQLQSRHTGLDAILDVLHQQLHISRDAVHACDAVVLLQGLVLVVLKVPFKPVS